MEKWPGINYRVKSPQMKGDNVKKIQAQLGNFGFATNVDGYYGNDTAKQVSRFQESKGLVVDRIVGEKTWNALFSNVEKAISTVQNESIVKGYIGLYEVKENTYNQRTKNKQLDMSKIGQTDTQITEFNSYVINLATNQWVPLPVVPESATENVASMWNDIQVPGRSASYRSYRGTSNRTFNFNIQLHMDLLADISKESTTMDLTTICDFFKSLVYPEYTKNALLPPVCILKLTDSFKMRGTVDSVGITYGLPIARRKYRGNPNQLMYNIANVSFQFTEVPIKAPTSSDIAKGKVFW